MYKTGVIIVLLVAIFALGAGFLIQCELIKPGFQIFRMVSLKVLLKIHRTLPLALFLLIGLGLFRLSRNSSEEPYKPGAAIIIIYVTMAITLALSLLLWEFRFQSGNNDYIADTSIAVAQTHLTGLLLITIFCWIIVHLSRKIRQRASGIWLPVLLGLYLIFGIGNAYFLFKVGLQGFPKNYYDYPNIFYTNIMAASLAALVMGISMLIVLLWSLKILLDV